MENINQQMITRLIVNSNSESLSDFFKETGSVVSGVWNKGCKMSLSPMLSPLLSSRYTANKDTCKLQTIYSEHSLLGSRSSSTKSDDATASVVSDFCSPFGRFFWFGVSETFVSGLVLLLPALLCEAIDEDCCWCSTWTVKSSQVAFNMTVASTLSYKRNTKYCAIQCECP